MVARVDWSFLSSDTACSGIPQPLRKSADLRLCFDIQIDIFLQPSALLKVSSASCNDMATMASARSNVPSTGPGPAPSDSIKDPVKAALVPHEAQAPGNEPADFQNDNNGPVRKRRHHFDRATEQSVQAAMSLSYQVVVASRESRPLPEISAAQGADLALLASDLIRILNSDQVVCHHSHPKASTNHC